MGTNFYWVLNDGMTPLGYDDRDLERDHPAVHLGKRSAAGAYCWPCKQTLCRGGEAGVHYGHGYYSACPKCGAPFDPTGYNSGMVELGFAKMPEPPNRPTGVSTASSFTWAQDRQQVLDYCTDHLWEYNIVDEYGCTFTGQQFLWMLESVCPIQFTHSIGVWFS